MHDFKVNRRLSLGKIIFSRRRNEVKFTNCKNSRSIEWYLTFNHCTQRLSCSASRQPSNLFFLPCLSHWLILKLLCRFKLGVLLWECVPLFCRVFFPGLLNLWIISVSEMLNLIKWAYRGKKLLWTLWSFLDIFFLLHTIAIDLRH